MKTKSNTGPARSRPGRRRRTPALLAGTALAVGLAVVPVAWAANQPSATTATAPTTTPGAIAPKLACAALPSLNLTGVQDAPSRITSATPLTIAGIDYCDAKGYIAPQTQFELKLPASTWHGRYLQLGCGGLCGDVPTSGPNPAPAVSTGCAPVTDGELVIASDNEGHLAANRFDGLWGKDDPELRTVFGHTSEHSLAQVAKTVIADFYGQAPSDAYFDGCSDGGREALIEAQRYPTDFNGIIAGAPVLDATDFTGIFETWIYQSDIDGQGNQILGVAKLPALHAAVLKECAGTDGLIADPRACGFDPTSVLCPTGTDTPTCLTPAEADVARKFYSGPVNAKGRDLYPGGLPYGSELAWAGWDISPTGVATTSNAAVLALNDLKYLAYDVNPPDSFALRDFRFTDAEFARLQQTAANFNATDADLTAFRKHGGKIILYQGWADQAVPPFGTTAYYQAVADTTKDYTSFSRLYMIPAQYHCLAGGDPQATGDLLTPLMSWVQTGQAPASVTFQTVKPTAGQPTSITVSPFNPDARVAGNGFNSVYHWIGHFGS